MCCWNSIEKNILQVQWRLDYVTIERYVCRKRTQWCRLDVERCQSGSLCAVIKCSIIAIDKFLGRYKAAIS